VIDGRALSVAAAGGGSARIGTHFRSSRSSRDASQLIRTSGVVLALIRSDATRFSIRISNSSFTTITAEGSRCVDALSRLVARRTTYFAFVDIDTAVRTGLVALSAAALAIDALTRLRAVSV